MAALGPEAAAAGETLVIEALPALLAIAGLMFALGLIKFVDGFVRALFGTVSGSVGWIPWLGSRAKGSIHKIEARITRFIGAIELSLDGYLGSSFHRMNRIIRKVGYEIEGLGHDLWATAKFLSAHPTWGEVKALARALTHPLAAFQYLERRLLRALDRRLARLDHSVAHGVYPRVRAGEAELTHVIEYDIAGLRARSHAIERRLDRLWRWAHRHPNVLAASVATAIAAIGLRKLGANWIRCRNWKRIGRAVCGMRASEVTALLGVLAGAAVLRDYRSLVRTMQDVEHDAAVEVIRLLRAFD